MTRTHENAGAWIGLSLLAALTAWAGTLGWHVLTDGFGQVSMASLVFGLPVLVAGGALRWWGVPPLVVAAGQAVGLGWVWFAHTTGSLVPDAAARAQAGAAWADGLETARRYAAPIGPDQPPVTVLLLAGALLVMWLVENLVGRFRAASVAGVVLLVAYVVPAAITGNAASWWIFALTAGLYVATLYRQHTLQIGEWGRVPGEGAGRYGANHEATTRVAAAIGAVAVGAALLVPSALPSPQMSFFDGPGTGPGKISVENPVADLRRDLVRPDDVPVLTIRSSDDRMPSYLRLSVLTRFSEGAWRPGDRAIPPEQAADGPMPDLDGVADAVARTETDYDVSVTDLFSSRWLPVADQSSRIDAGSDWLYDLTTRDVMAADEDDSTAGLSYSFTGVRLDLDAEKLDATTSARNMVRPLFLEVPSSVPPQVRALADQVTAEAPTRFQKAQRLQQWFRQDGGFTYDLRAVDDAGSSASDLAAFLDEDTGRVGYCEQFAAAMAIMARSLDIPARVAIGFLEPERLGPREWEYSAWDMHAWPELYFPDAGWVRFEPTPSARAQSVPDYTTATLDANPTTVPAPTSAGPTEDLPERSPERDPSAAEDSSVEESALAAWLPWIGGGAAGLAVLVALALAPRWWRSRQRRQRRTGDPDAAWAELRAHTLDLGLRWPDGRSPAHVASVLEAHLAPPVERAGRQERPRRGRTAAPQAAEALDRLRRAVEVHRYAAASEASADPSDLRVVTDALSAGVTPRAERRAAWWPRSIFTRASAPTGPLPTSASAERSS